MHLSNRIFRSKGEMPMASSVSANYNPSAIGMQPASVTQMVRSTTVVHDLLNQIKSQNKPPIPAALESDTQTSPPYYDVLYHDSKNQNNEEGPTTPLITIQYSSKEKPAQDAEEEEWSCGM